MIVSFICIVCLSSINLTYHVHCRCVVAYGKYLVGSKKYHNVDIVLLHNIYDIMEDEEYNNEYDALASTMNIEDISSNEHNQEILRRLKENDPSFFQLWICNENQIHNQIGYVFDFCPNNGEELGWLGYYIGKNTTLKHLYISSTPSPSCNAGIEDFRRGLGRNNSIRKLSFFNHRRLDGQIFHMLDLFFKTNDNLNGIEVTNCILGVDSVRQLSLALGECKKSLKTFSMSSHNQTRYGQLVDVILALSMHPQLKRLDLYRTIIERNEYTALATLLRNTTQQLDTLNLNGSNIDDEGVEALAHAINGSKLADLTLSDNPTITIRGWKTLSTLFEMPDCDLEKLTVESNNIGDEGALIFANALRGNIKLKTLDLSGNGIADEGWARFSRLLCDTSSINNTYLSNHTLRDLGIFHQPLPTDLLSSIDLNASRGDRGQIAMIKILQHHSHFNMQPFFEWEFRVLPLVVAWLEKANACTSAFEEKIDRIKLSCMYDFVREFPMLYIEPVTRKEIEECSAMEKKLQGGQSQQPNLEEVQRCKARALRRL